MSVDLSLTAAQHDLAKRTHEFAEEVVRVVAPEYDQRQEFQWPVLEEAVDLEPSGGSLNRWFGHGTPMRSRVADAALSAKDRLPAPIMRLAMNVSPARQVKEVRYGRQDDGPAQRQSRRAAI